MISLIFTLIFSSFSFSSNEMEIKPSFQNSPYIAQSDSETNLDPGQKFDLMRQRGNDLCAFYKAPEGRYRSRIAARMKTNKVKTNGQKVAILKRSGQSLSPTIGRVGPNLKTEVFLSIVCKGKQ